MLNYNDKSFDDIIGMFISNVMRKAADLTRQKGMEFRKTKT